MININVFSNVGLARRARKEEVRVDPKDTRPDDSPLSAQELADVEAWAREVSFDEFVQEVDLTDEDIETWLAATPNVSVSTSLHERMLSAMRRALNPELNPECAATPGEVVSRLMAASYTAVSEAARLLNVSEEALSKRLRDPLGVLDPTLAPKFIELSRHFGVSLRDMLNWLALAARRHLGTQARLRLSTAPLSRLDVRTSGAPNSSPHDLLHAAASKDLTRVRSFFAAAVGSAYHRPSGGLTS
jgi:hypothetical protein